MTGFLSRNLKVFFRDRSAVFFSLLAVLIILGLYLLFLGDVWVDGMPDMPGARLLMDNWIMSGVLAVASLTTTMGAFGTMVDDKSKNFVKDFYSSPVGRSKLAAGYILSAYIIGVIMTFVALAFAQLYLLANGGGLIPLATLIKIMGLILLSTLSNTALVLFVVSFINSQNAFGTASSIVGTLVGFITGIYIPVGILPAAVQYVVKVFPVSHAAVLLRQIMMEAPMAASFAGAPPAQAEEFKEMMGMTFKLGGHTMTPAVSIAILVATALLFYGLSVSRLSVKKA